MRYSFLLKPFTLFFDIAILNIAVFLANIFTIKFYSTEIQSSNFLLLINLTWITVASLTKNFEFHRPLVLSQNIKFFFTSMIYHLVLVLGVIYFFKLFEISRVQLLFTYSFFLPLIVIERALIFGGLDYIRIKGFNVKHIIVIGDNDVLRRVENSFKQHPEYGYNLKANISEQALLHMTEEMLFDSIIKADVSEVFVCDKSISQTTVNSLVEFGEYMSIKIKFVPDLILSKRIATMVNYENFPAIQLSDPVRFGLKVLVFKRLFDIVFSSVIMIAGFPVFILLMLITKFSSKGPTFYAQERVGKNNKPFKIYKFRSMFVNSESLGPQLSKDHDPRITKWGRIIRKSRFDELPQFWNVLKGEMSVVGPRPERQFFIDQLIEKCPGYQKLLRLKPGLTSMGQVNFGYAENIDQMRKRVRYDMIYLNNITFNNDISIIMQTLKVMVQLKGK